VAGFGMDAIALSISKAICERKIVFNFKKFENRKFHQRCTIKPFMSRRSNPQTVWTSMPIFKQV